MLKSENSLIKWIIIFFILSLITFFASIAQADCLDSEQVNTVSIITTKLNLSLNETLKILDLFEFLCENTTYNVTQNITQNITYEYNDSLLMENISSLLNKSEDLEDSLNELNGTFKFYWNNTTVSTELEHIWDRMTTREVIDEWNESMLSERAEAVDELEEAFDEKLDYMQRTYLKTQEWNKTVNEMWAYIRNIPQEGDWYAKMAFWIVVGLVGLIAVYIFGGSRIRGKFKRMKIEPKQYPIDEETSESDIMRKTDKIRNLKIKIAKDANLTVDERNALIKKVDLNEVWDDDSLEKEVDIIMSLKKADKSVSKRNGVKKRKN